MKQIDYLIKRYPELEDNRRILEQVCMQIIKAYEAGKKIMVCGNGGSCADSDHIVGELMKGFCKRRPISSDKMEKITAVDKTLGMYIASRLQSPLRAINLCVQAGLNTAFCNDVDSELVYAQQAFGYSDKGDILIGLSTSGNSKNVINAGIVAKAMGVVVIGMTGNKPCKMDELFDYVIHVPESETYKIQELHLPIYHAVCLEVEDYFFEK